MDQREWEKFQSNYYRPRNKDLVLSDTEIYGCKRWVCDRKIIDKYPIDGFPDGLDEGWWWRIDKASNKFYYFSWIEFRDSDWWEDLYGEDGFKWTWSYRPPPDIIEVSEQQTIVKSVVDFFKRLWYSIAY